MSTDSEWAPRRYPPNVQCGYDYALEGADEESTPQAVRQFKSGMDEANNEPQEAVG